MSRLGDMFGRIDRKSARPLLAGGIPDLARQAITDTRRRWRRWPVAVIVLTVAIGVGLAALSRPGYFRGAREAPAPAGVGDGRGAGSSPELASPDAEVWNGRGLALISEGDVGNGITALRRAVELDPRHVEAHRNLALALERQGESAEASLHYRTFLRLREQRDTTPAGATPR